MRKYKDMILFLIAMIVIAIGSIYAGYITPGQ